MAEQPSITSILAALAAQRSNTAPLQSAPPTAYPAAPSTQPQNPYGNPGGYALPQPTNSGSVDLSNIKPVSSGSVSIADAIAKAKAIAAEKGVAYDRAPSYGSADLRASGGHPYRTSRSRSRSPQRRDNFRDNFNPYRDERRGGDRAPPGRDYRERSFSPGPRSRGAAGTFSPPRGTGAYNARERSPVRGGEENNVESISIESNLVGLIIGRQGENLRRVEGETGCRVQFITGPDETGPYRQCKITGTRAQRTAAKAEIKRIIDDSGMAGSARAVLDRASRDAVPVARGVSHQPTLRDGEDSMQIMVPDRTVGLIIGRGGETIRDLQERSGCHVNIVGESKSVNGLRPVNLIGSREAATRAKDLIMEIVESDSKSQGGKDRPPVQREAGRDAGFGTSAGGGGDKITDSIYVPSEAVGMIIGKGGETIKEMQSTTGCKINVSPSSGPGEVEREIGLVGSREAIAAAKRAIEDKVEAVQAKNGGGRSRAPQNDYGGDRAYSQQSYSQPQPQTLPQQAQAAPQANAEDPYAAYGGYQAYLQMWYAAMAQQQQAGQQPGSDASKPPGTS
ncbi:hypothetical protein BP5796_06451 [Coleophoma crateriformis]|uniref:K Homology domain-containing protein n=1 Tax=Coleophoma crateriformis TaxID=565419 RepID=A0A3D8RNU6_9HELO|nr:hypothetical protein BP5796_06451 [Coleophoma crateriformis]